jgi:hypothetical protein
MKMWLLEHLKNTLLSPFKKKSCNGELSLKKKPLTKSFVMKIGCKIRVSRFKALEQAIPGTPCSKRLT